MWNFSTATHYVCCGNTVNVSDMYLICLNEKVLHLFIKMCTSEHKYLKSPLYFFLFYFMIHFISLSVITICVRDNNLSLLHASCWRLFKPWMHLETSAITSLKLVHVPVYLLFFFILCCASALLIVVQWSQGTSAQLLPFLLPCKMHQDNSYFILRQKK